MTSIKSKQACLLTSEYIRKNLIVHHQDDGGVLQTYQDGDGSVSSVVYRLFPGVALIRKDVNRVCFLSNWRKQPERGFVIEHCWRGRMECQEGQACLYPAPGDVIIYRTDYAARKLQFPLGYFHSIAVSVNLDELSPELAAHLHTADFSMDELIRTYRLKDHFYCILKNTAPIVRIFEDIHNAPESVKLAYWKLKVVEMLVLLYADVSQVNERPERRISSAQAAVAKAARQHLLNHPYERITIDELAERFAVSASHLKEGFRVVYGTSIKRFDREHKMQVAAQLLRETHQQVGDIARQFGYVNTSKFSSAFQAVHGKNPMEYREAHQQCHTDIQ